MIKLVLVSVLAILLTGCISRRLISIDTAVVGSVDSPKFEHNLQVTVDFDNQTIGNRIIPAGNQDTWPLITAPYKSDGYKVKVTYAFVNDPSSANSVEFLAKVPYPTVYSVYAQNKNGSIELYCQGQYLPDNMQGVCAPAKTRLRVGVVGGL